MDALKAKAMTQPVEVILSAVLALAETRSAEGRMARAALIDAYAAKTSPAEADALMDTIGL